MKFEITKEIENEINVMIGVARSAESIKKEYPNIWSILSNEFIPDGYYKNGHIQDSEENIKIRIFAEIMRKKNEIEVRASNIIKE